MTEDQHIIYITGRGGDANKDLGGHLKALELHRIGLSVNRIFLKLDFNEQVNVVTKMIIDFDSSPTFFVANSYGSYLCLHTLIDAPRYLFSFLFLSPAIGLVLNQQAMVYSGVPSCQFFNQAVTEKRITKPNFVTLHIGDCDLDNDSEAFKELGATLGTDQLHILKGQGHALDKGLTQNIIKQFLSTEVQ